MEENKELTTNEQVSIQDLSKQYEQEVEAHKKDLESIDDVDKLLQMEQDIIKEQDELTKVLFDKTYKLPTRLTWDEKEYSINQIGKKIVGLLNKIEIQFSYTLGYYQVGKFWMHPVRNINYNTLDTTLRILGNDLKFKGIQEWEDILIINEFFRSTNDEYTRDLLKNILYANKHNNIVDRLQMLKPVETAEESK